MMRWCRDLGYRASVAWDTTGLMDDGYDYTDCQSSVEAGTLPLHSEPRVPNFMFWPKEILQNHRGSLYEREKEAHPVSRRKDS